MKKLIAVLLAALLVCGVAGCGNNSVGETGGNTPITKRASSLGYGLNAHVYELRAMDPSSTMDYVADMTSVLGIEYYRLSTPLESLFTVEEGDTLVFKEGQKELIHQLVKKMSAAGVKKFVAVSDATIYPYGYEVTSNGVVPDPAVEKEMYIRWVRLYAKAWGKIVEEFPEITHVETMNEPDIQGANIFTKQGHQWGADDGYVYSMTDKAHMIADLQYYTYKEVKAVDQDVLVTTPGFSTHGEGHDILDYLYEAIESGAHPFDAEAADINPDDYFDVINFHKYLDQGDTIDDYFEHVDSFYKACERHNDAGKMAIITECGFTDDGNEAREVENGEKMMQLLELYNEKMPYVEAAMFYMLNDYHNYSVSSSEDNFGLFTSAGDPEKPSCPKPAALTLYKYMHDTEDVAPIYKYCPELMP